MLESLKAEGCRVFVATSKPESLANEVLNHFDLAKYFEKICGATMDGSRSHKADVIRYLLAQVSGVENIVMVGDTAYDVIGAAEHQIPCIGVSWGYGLVEDMLNAGAVKIAHSPEELAQMIL
jgi:phosphoglycolate phosphatase